MQTPSLRPKLRQRHERRKDTEAAKQMDPPEKGVRGRNGKKIETTTASKAHQTHGENENEDKQINGNIKRIIKTISSHFPSLTHRHTRAARQLQFRRKELASTARSRKSLKRVAQ